MSKPHKNYDLDPETITATLAELPGEFALTDLSRHARMLAAHAHMVSEVYDSLVATFLTAYRHELGLALVGGSPFEGDARWRKVTDAVVPEAGALHRYQRRPLAVGVRVYCPPAGLTGKIIESNNDGYSVHYDLGTVRWESARGLRAALPGETTGAKGLPPDDPLFAEQQAQLAESGAYLASRQASSSALSEPAS
jgi:hypothetical protein